MAEPRNCSGAMSATKAAGAGPLMDVPIAEKSNAVMNQPEVGANAAAATPTAAEVGKAARRGDKHKPDDAEPGKDQTDLSAAQTEDLVRVERNQRLA